MKWTPGKSAGKGVAAAAVPVTVKAAKRTWLSPADKRRERDGARRGGDSLHVFFLALCHDYPFPALGKKLGSHFLPSLPSSSPGTQGLCQSDSDTKTKPEAVLGFGECHSSPRPNVNGQCGHWRRLGGWGRVSGEEDSLMVAEEVWLVFTFPLLASSPFPATP